MANPFEDDLNRVVRAFAEDKEPHDMLRSKWERAYRSYRGMIETRSDADSWTNKQHPAYVWQVVETMTSNIGDTTPRWKVTVSPGNRPMDEMERMIAGARANELLLNHQLCVDKYAEKQRTFDMQALICGITGARQSWEYKEGVRRVLTRETKPIHGLLGSILGHAERVVPKAEKSVLRDNPTTEVVDMRDLIWHQAATSLKNCMRVTHRMWVSYDDLLGMEAVGALGAQAGGQAVGDTMDTRDVAADEGIYSRESTLFSTKRTKDQIELLEHWVKNPNVEGGLEQIVVANRKIVLARRPSPFWFEHLEHPFPFVVCSAAPDMFRIPGMSEVEFMAELQEMLWTLMNQRLDNLQLVNNAIMMIADDVEDPDAFEFAPGERWLVSRPVEESVKSWSPDIRVAELSLNAEGQVKQDLYDVSGGQPLLAGSDTQILQGTATAASIATTLAQKRLAAKKQQFIWARARIGEQWIALNQQFIREPRLIPAVGADGAQAFHEMQPMMLQGDYSIEVEMADESLVRQERRAEATSKFQVVLQAAGIMAQMGVSPNLKAYCDDFLDAYDIMDKERYYSAQPPPSPTGAPPGAGANGAPPAPGSSGGLPGQGITNPGLAAGLSSPSNATSMNPAASLQRILATKGGAANAQ